MKKKLIICSIITLIVVGIGIILRLIFKDMINESKQKRYVEIKENIQEDIAGYLRVAAPYCQPGNSAQWIITDEALVYQRGMSKDKLLDIDGESYCKVRVETRCVDENKYEWDTYLSCKNYEDENYNNWEERGKNNDEK